MRHESLSLTQLLEKHWRTLRHETSITEFAFGASVREHYEANVAAHARTVEWSTQVDTVARMRRDAEKINRWFREDVHARFPVEALESFIAAFPPDRRFTMQLEIAARQGLLAIPIPTAHPGADGANLGAIGKETGEAIIALSELLSDDVIDHRDADKAGKAITQIDEAMAVLAEMRERIQRQAMPEPRRAYGVVRLKTPSPR